MARFDFFDFEPHSIIVFFFLMGGGLGYIVFYSAWKIFDGSIRPRFFPNLPPLFVQPRIQQAEAEDGESDPVVIALQRSVL